MQLHTWQPLSMCHQNSVRGWLENSLHQERIHAECFLTRNAQSILPYVRSTPIKLSPPLPPSLYHTHTLLNSAGRKAEKGEKTSTHQICVLFANSATLSKHPVRFVPQATTMAVHFANNSQAKGRTTILKWLTLFIYLELSGELRNGTCHFCTRYTGVYKNQ